MTENRRQVLRASLWSPLRLAYGLLPVLTLLQRHGINANRLFDQARIERFGLMDPTYTIDIEQELSFVTAAIGALPQPEMSLEMARGYRLRGFSVLGLAMQAAATPLHMLQLIMRYPRLAWGLFDGELELDDETLCIRFLPEPRLGSSESFLVERDMACALVLTDEACEQPFPVAEIRFRHECHGDPRTYRQFFRCPVHFGAEHNELYCSRAAVEQPLPQAEATMCAFYEAQCERMSRDMDQAFRYADAVRKRLFSTTPTPDLADLAATMFLTSRTLQRRLAAEGRSFSELLREVRVQRAQQLLTDHSLTLEQIANHLGFSDAVAFSHAFKSWEGQSPRDWRQGHRQAINRDRV